MADLVGKDYKKKNKKPVSNMSKMLKEAMGKIKDSGYE
jgi:hypothetical protein